MEWEFRITEFFLGCGTAYWVTVEEIAQIE